MTEAEYQKQVVALARTLGYVVKHPPATRTASGRWTTQSMVDWPDLILIRPPRLIVAELKGVTTMVTPGQWETLRLLEQCDGVEAYLWRAGVTSLQDVADILARKAARV